MICHLHTVDLSAVENSASLNMELQSRASKVSTNFCTCLSDVHLFVYVRTSYFAVHNKHQQPAYVRHTCALCRFLGNAKFQFENSQSRGELLVSLCYQPATNKVTVVVLKAKNLPKFDITGLSGDFISFT